ncbi:hypothetical protein TNIN_329161 [Trichonephila inaurata madagascariensis]|uniref:Uncharacterized protein n=1 Tax=Trichonephila inaurata madagascariensis TaxID=2747483 RepID=A0A8X6WR83_9ARAC|nr:hypothetical protein TNIN_329161 [Trichonephila inaurata madagascariensis]
MKCDESDLNKRKACRDGALTCLLSPSRQLECLYMMGNSSELQHRGWENCPRRLVSVMRTFKRKVYPEFLDNYTLPTGWQLSGGLPFLFQHDRTPTCTARFVQTCSDGVNAQELK